MKRFAGLLADLRFDVTPNGSFLQSEGRETPQQALAPVDPVNRGHVGWQGTVRDRGWQPGPTSD